MLALAAVLTLLAVAAAGCGSSKTPSVASLATTTVTGSTTSGGSAQSAIGSRAALASCFASHGFQASVGSGDGGGRSLSVFGVTLSGNVDPDSAQFQAAMQAC